MEHTQIEQIEEKLQNLLSRYKRLQKENASLKDALHVTSTALAQSKNTVAALQQKLEVQNIGVQHMEEAQKQQLSKRIDAYIKEINVSLAMLNA